MERSPVESSNLTSVGYDAASQVLEVEFNSGGIYRYDNVPPSVYEGFLAAQSKGAYFNSIIKPTYPVTMVAPKTAEEPAP